ncbi:hypothetical protein J2T60_001604 [Natronospira proteinivora]|uniref:DUF2779 domain-containing protein n=1 Tax=Natronospira proteinivora TaxID=1807133 RepID=A0ABT1G8G3_9GAMM|nr:DUF2779 domain-containing protein [Natronospira proteinivora]MCP1727604.1 hypothetical protein [Natronospira proteinivora]
MSARKAKNSRISKSRFISGTQCPLRLWYDIHARHLAAPPDEGLEAVFATGHAVGELAQKRWSGGVLVDGPYWEVERAIERTQALMADLSVPAIYEAAIEHRGVLTRVDILARAPEGGWDLVEVKSSTRVKEPFDTDVALQYWILRGAGLDVRRAGVLVLNRDYVYPGGEYDLDQLFHFEDLTADSEHRLGEIEAQVFAFQEVVASEEPEVEIGDHCFTPYDCPYYGHCSRDVEFSEQPIDWLPRLGKKRDELRAIGAESIDEIPDGFPLSNVQERVRRCVASGEAWVSPALGRALERVEWPLYFLDFEAAMPALPRWPGTSPYGTVPFQFSCHSQARPDAELEHSEFLATSDDDPREALARALLECLGEQGSIIVYSSYESRVLGLLADAVPALRGELLALRDRLCDLLPVVRDHYCHPGFRGSYSIKAVLPVLAPGMDYGDLEVADGQAAARSWLQMLDCADAAERERLENALRVYCRQDSLAMVRIREALLRVVGR